MPPKTEAKDAEKPKKAAAPEAAVGREGKAYWVLPTFKADDDGVPLCKLPPRAEEELGMVDSDNKRRRQRGFRAMQVWAVSDGYGEEECPYQGAAMYISGTGIGCVQWIDTAEDLLSIVKCACCCCAPFARHIRRVLLVHGPAHRRRTPGGPPRRRCLWVSLL